MMPKEDEGIPDKSLQGKQERRLRVQSKERPSRNDDEKRKSARKERSDSTGSGSMTWSTASSSGCLDSEGNHSSAEDIRRQSKSGSDRSQKKHSSNANRISSRRGSSVQQDSTSSSLSEDRDEGESSQTSVTRSSSAQEQQRRRSMSQSRPPASQSRRPSSTRSSSQGRRSSSQSRRSYRERPNVPTSTKKRQNSSASSSSTDRTNARRSSERGAAPPLNGVDKTSCDDAPPLPPITPPGDGNKDPKQNREVVKSPNDRNISKSNLGRRRSTGDERTFAETGDHCEMDHNVAASSRVQSSGSRKDSENIRCPSPRNKDADSTVTRSSSQTRKLSNSRRASTGGTISPVYIPPVCSSSSMRSRGRNDEMPSSSKAGDGKRNSEHDKNASRRSERPPRRQSGDMSEAASRRNSRSRSASRSRQQSRRRSSGCGVDEERSRRQKSVPPRGRGSRESKGSRGHHDRARSMPPKERQRNQSNPSREGDYQTELTHGSRQGHNENRIRRVGSCDGFGPRHGERRCRNTTRDDRHNAPPARNLSDGDVSLWMMSQRERNQLDHIIVHAKEWERDKTRVDPLAPSKNDNLSESIHREFNQSVSNLVHAMTSSRDVSQQPSKPASIRRIGKMTKELGHDLGQATNRAIGKVADMLKTGGPNPGDPHGMKTYDGSTMASRRRMTSLVDRVATVVDNEAHIEVNPAVDPVTKVPPARLPSRIVPQATGKPKSTWEM